MLLWKSTTSRIFVKCWRTDTQTETKTETETQTQTQTQTQTKAPSLSFQVGIQRFLGRLACLRLLYQLVEEGLVLLHHLVGVLLRVIHHGIEADTQGRMHFPCLCCASR